MKPALLRFLNILKQKLNETVAGIDPSLENLSAVNDLKKLLEDFIKNEKIDDEAANAFIKGFYEIEKQSNSSNLPLFTKLKNNEIYTLQLLLHGTEVEQEFNQLSLITHFSTFLGCPFKVESEDNQLKCVLIYNPIGTESGKEQRENGQRFYNVLVSLGIAVPNTEKVDGNKFIITIAPGRTRDLCQLAQFELIDEKTISKKLEDSEQKFRLILTELIQTEITFSVQAGKLAALLEEKLNSPQCPSLEKKDRELLIKAQENYSEIANNPYPWFGEKITKDYLQRMSFDEMLELCHDLHFKLTQNADDKAKEIGERLGKLRWVSIHYSEINRLINEENVLKLTEKLFIAPENGHRGESEKEVANLYLIPPVQRLPRIVLLFGELIKCLNAALSYNAIDEKKSSYLRELKALNEKWIKIAKRTNELVNKLKENDPNDIIKSIFQSFDRLKTGSKTQDISDSIYARSIIGDLFQPDQFSKRPRTNQLEDNKEPKNPKNTYNELDQNIAPSEEKIEILTNIPYEPLNIAENFHNELDKSIIFSSEEKTNNIINFAIEDNESLEIPENFYDELMQSIIFLPKQEVELTREDSEVDLTRGVIFSSSSSRKEEEVVNNFYAKLESVTDHPLSAKGAEPKPASTTAVLNSLTDENTSNAPISVSVPAEKEPPHSSSSSLIAGIGYALIVLGILAIITGITLAILLQPELAFLVLAAILIPIGIGMVNKDSRENKIEDLSKHIKLEEQPINVENDSLLTETSTLTNTPRSPISQKNQNEPIEKKELQPIKQKTLQ